MARIHARVKGKSGSTRPVKVDLSFVTLKKAEVEKLVIKLAKEDVKMSVIGITLRDTYGVPSVRAMTGKSISDILKKENLLTKVPEDLQNLIDRATRLKKHLGNNSRDTHNTRGLALIESKIRRLTKYYKNTGALPESWKMN